MGDAVCLPAFVLGVVGPEVDLEAGSVFWEPAILLEKAKQIDPPFNIKGVFTQIRLLLFHVDFINHPRKVKYRLLILHHHLILSLSTIISLILLRRVSRDSIRSQLPMTQRPRILQLLRVLPFRMVYRKLYMPYSFSEAVLTIKANTA